MEPPLRFIPKMDDFLEDPEIKAFKRELGDAVLSILREELGNLRKLIKTAGLSVGDSVGSLSLADFLQPPVNDTDTTAAQSSINILFQFVFIGSPFTHF